MMSKVMGTDTHGLMLNGKKKKRHRLQILHSMIAFA